MYEFYHNYIYRYLPNGLRLEINVNLFQTSLLNPAEKKIYLRRYSLYEGFLFRISVEIYFVVQFIQKCIDK